MIGSFSCKSLRKAGCGQSCFYTADMLKVESVFIDPGCTSDIIIITEKGSAADIRDCVWVHPCLS